MVSFARPIGPLRSVEGWKELPIAACDEELVPLGPFSDYPEIATDSIYVGERTSSPYKWGSLHGALHTLFVQKGVAERLKKASQMLPKGHLLLVFDAYRPLAVQKALFDYYVEELVKGSMSRERATVDAQKFVSIPSEDPTRPPPHYTGGAVDLTVIRFSPGVWKRLRELNRIVKTRETPENWRQLYKAEMERLTLIRLHSAPLDMGVRFDEVSESTATRYFEELDRPLTAGELLVRNNRRMLWNVMVKVGFSNYCEETWHYDYGNQFHAARTGEPAVYGGIPLSAENRAFEDMRRGHYIGCVLMAEKRHPGGAGKMPHELYQFVSEVNAHTGDVRETTHPRACAI